MEAKTMPEPTPDQLELARRLREREIRALSKCTCAFPLVAFRNGHGHHPKCPASEKPDKALNLGISDPIADELLEARARIDTLEAGLARIAGIASRAHDNARAIARGADLDKHIIVTPTQLVEDQTYKTWVPTAADGEIIGEQLAARLAPMPILADEPRCREKGQCEDVDGSGTCFGCGRYLKEST